MDLPLQKRKTEMELDDDADANFPPPATREKYDVFLSFRGEDTRIGFTSHLHVALRDKKIETYIDYRLEKGDEVGPALLEAIEKSTISVIIFSQNYASSTWCLQELAHILECKKKGQLVIPIFYHISPSDVRFPKESYADAFAKLEQRFMNNMEKVNEWRSALEEAANLSGCVISNKTSTEADLVVQVVEYILTKLSRNPSSDVKGLVGIEWRIQKIESLLCMTDSQEVFSVGIWGMGGIGKTTLADAVYHRHSSKFEARCFLANVREESDKRGLNHLRNQLLRQILKDKDLTIDTPSIADHVKKRLGSTKALIVLDDVNHSSQLECLLADDVPFGPGSRIIITTRDRSLLKKKDVHDEMKIYEAERLNGDEAHLFFQSRAFKKNSCITDYTEMSKVVLDYAGGMPLAVKVLGSSFISCKSKQEWQDILNNFRNSPSDDIRQVLRLSYNVLKKEVQEMFLDIACFYKGERLPVAERMLHIHGFDNVRDGIQALIDKSLISISVFRDRIEMHDVVQEVGWETVRGECIKEAGRRSRLYNAKDVCHVLENNTGSDAVETIYLDQSKISELHLSRAVFKKMHNLRVLKIYNFASHMNVNCCKLYLPQGVQSLPKALRYFCWEGFPFQSLPSKNFTENLVELHFPYSQLEQLIWNKDQPLVNFKVINLSYCTRLIEVPDLSRSPKIEHINLDGCTSLIQFRSDFQSLENLTDLHLTGCSNLKHLPEMPDNIKVLRLSRSGIKELPSSVWCMEKLGTLEVTYCESLEKLPSNSCKLNLTGTFNLQGCSSLSKFWELPRHIEGLDLSSTSIEELPSSIEYLSSLNEINLRDCKRVVSLPTSIWKLKYLESLDLTGCSRFECFPEILESMEHMKKLSLDDTAVKELPSSIENLIGLQELNLSGSPIESIPSSIKLASHLTRLCLNNCTHLQALPELPLKLTELEADGLHSLKTVSRSMPALSQDWANDYQFVYTNCLKLDQEARNNIMADAHQRIMGMALSYHKNTALRSSSIITACSGEEIPKWFKYQSEGSSITIKLPPDWFNSDFLGFALSLVVEFNNCDAVDFAVDFAAEFGNFDVEYDVKPWFVCEFNFKTSNGQSQEFIELYGPGLKQQSIEYDEVDTFDGRNLKDEYDEDDTFDGWNLNDEYDYDEDDTFDGRNLNDEYDEDDTFDGRNLNDQYDEDDNVFVWYDTEYHHQLSLANGVLKASFSTKQDNMTLKKCGIHLLYSPKSVGSIYCIPQNR